MGTGRVVVIGGGIVGLATAWHLAQRGVGGEVLEKEPALAAHQTGRNSGVIHSGIYYKPGSAKATLCRAGRAQLLDFCADHAVPFDLCGKVIVATNEAERGRLADLAERGRANGVSCEQIDDDRLRAIEPAVRSIGGPRAAILVHDAGIVDYAAVCFRLAELIGRAGGTVRTGVRVLGVRDEAAHTLVRTTAADLTADAVVNCAGQHSDRVARSAGATPEAMIVPFRGEYYELRESARRLCRGLIYPVPDPAFPFLGVHFTRMIGGGVECGPNAVLALAREGYRRRDIEPRTLAELARSAGFRRFARTHWRTGASEAWRSLSKAAFVHALRGLVPEVSTDDLTPRPAGVRAQAMAPDGRLVDDFVIQRLGRAVHVLNAPSPAATAGLAIGQRVADEVLAGPLSCA